MKRFLIIGLMLFSQVDKALAESVSDRVFASLKAQGYLVVQHDRTWLGRIWVLARNKTMQREVVFDPTSGEILRDYTVLLADLDAQGNIGVAEGVDSATTTAPVAATPTAPVALATDVGETNPVVVLRDLPQPLVVASPPVADIEPEAFSTDAVQAQAMTGAAVVKQ
jgi:hypothetical protein